MLYKPSRERGFGLIEVLMSLALLGIIAATFLMAIAIASNALLLADERTTAESLARSQMEFLKEQVYCNAVGDINGDGVFNEAVYDEIDISGDPQYSSFNIGSIIYNYENMEYEAVEQIIGIPWDSEDGEPVFPDIGFQKIKLVICNNGEDGVSLEDYVFILEDYKVDR
jgi:prepilin-type N-terminal cleavage/methylation domain-containing protein